ncbi:HPt (histidine-containing phosphotransfer) domain-containing protein [Aquamicrobium terrae]|uniref:Hpt domain-containing protein n=1 Tax=Mesorhizobium sp. PUT5 TaxID=3454629 RepID=UPI003FA4A826
MREEDDAAFSRPGGEACGAAPARPIDLAHLARQTLDDRDLEREVLGLFVQQAISVRDSIADADTQQRRLLAHGLKGAARGVGAFVIADWAAEVEKDPQDVSVLPRLGELIEQVRDFIAAIDR